MQQNFRRDDYYCHHSHCDGDDSEDGSDKRNGSCNIDLGAMVRLTSVVVRLSVAVMASSLVVPVVVLFLLFLHPLSQHHDHRCHHCRHWHGQYLPWNPGPTLTLNPVHEPVRKTRPPDEVMPLRPPPGLSPVLTGLPGS